MHVTTLQLSIGAHVTTQQLSAGPHVTVLTANPAVLTPNPEVLTSNPAVKTRTLQLLAGPLVTFLDDLEALPEQVVDEP